MSSGDSCLDKYYPPDNDLIFITERPIYSTDKDGWGENIHGTLVPSLSLSTSLAFPHILAIIVVHEELDLSLWQPHQCSCEPKCCSQVMLDLVSPVPSCRDSPCWNSLNCVCVCVCFDDVCSRESTRMYVSACEWMCACVSKPQSTPMLCIIISETSHQHSLH